MEHRLWLKFYLFGKPKYQLGRDELTPIEFSKVQELLCFVLIHRDRPQTREALGGLLWGDTVTERSRKYLRQALWQLQSSFRCKDCPGEAKLLDIDANWVQVNREADFWLDIAEFESAYEGVSRLQGRDLQAQNVEELRNALDLYQGDLLEGWYQDWCLFDRERLQNMSFEMLEKLMDYNEAHQQYQTALMFGKRILRYDRSRERIHRRVMRLLYLSGDRTEALQQYERCTAALREELDIGPSRSTKGLFEQIRSDQVELAPPVMNSMGKGGVTVVASSGGTVDRLNWILSALKQIQGCLQEEIHNVESIINDHLSS